MEQVPHLLRFQTTLSSLSIAPWWKILSNWSERSLQAIQQVVLNLSIRHIHGPKKIAWNSTEFVVLCLVRNGEEYIQSFIDYYSELGSSFIVFLDNGSTDATVPIAKSYDNVAILRTNLPYRWFRYAMKRYLASEFTGGWCLLVDIDERFDYPFSQSLRMDQLLIYLNQKRYTAAVSQMLDMFPDSPLNSVEASEIEAHTYYDLTNITEHPYAFDNIVSNPRIRVLQGGIRKTIFGNDELLLTKHSLFLLQEGVQVLDSHTIRKAFLADFSTVLYHYKFVGRFLDRTREAVERKNYKNNSADYQKYYRLLSSNAELCLRRNTAQKLVNDTDLVQQNFLVVSDEFVAWSAQHDPSRSQ